MGGVSGLQDFLPSRNNGLGAAVMHGLRRQSGNALVAVFGVLPGEKRPSKISAIFQGTKAFGKIGAIFQGFELTFRERVESET